MPMPTEGSKYPPGDHPIMPIAMLREMAAYFTDVFAVDPLTGILFVFGNVLLFGTITISGILVLGSVLALLRPQKRT